MSSLKPRPRVVLDKLLVSGQPLLNRIEGLHDSYFSYSSSGGENGHHTTANSMASLTLVATDRITSAMTASHAVLAL